ncbi:MAG: tetratricopeptide repeat protein [Maricaulaceae bacterium]
MQKISLSILLSLAFLTLAIPASAQINLPRLEAPIEDKPEFLKDETDYSHLSEAEEKAARLDKLFEKLAVEEEEGQAELIAEEIWVLWTRSGSASIDLAMRRGANAQARLDFGLARRMFDNVTTLKPDYAEGWARSGRLALTENNLDRAIAELTKALIIEPRHFFALTSLGRVMENLERYDEALAIYNEAYKLYPKLEVVASRREALMSSVEGDVL